MDNEQNEEVPHEELKEHYSIGTVIESGRPDGSATLWVHYHCSINGWACEAPSNSTMMFEMENYDGQRT